jgi:hypothetical protein
VRIFDKDGNVKGQFFAYDQNFRGGVNVALANIRGISKRMGMEIITAPNSNGGSHIKIFDNQGNLLNHFFAYHKKFRGGVNLSSIDLDNDGSDEIVTGAGPGGAPHLRIFSSEGVLKKSFYALDASFSGGVKVYKINY